MTATLFFGVRLWPGAEAYFVPEFISELPLLAASRDRRGDPEFRAPEDRLPDWPALPIPRSMPADDRIRRQARSRRRPTRCSSRPTVDKRRLVVTAGNFTDPRHVRQELGHRGSAPRVPQHGLHDARLVGLSRRRARVFVRRSRGALLGRLGAALRRGSLPPQLPNRRPSTSGSGSSTATRSRSSTITCSSDKPGAVRLLGYRNSVYSGAFADAIAAFRANPAENAAGCGSANLYNFGSGNATAPDLCWVRKQNVKMGIGINVEQYITDDIGALLSRHVLRRTDRGRRVQCGRPLSLLRGHGQGLCLAPPVRPRRSRLRDELDLARYTPSTWRWAGVDNFIGDGHLSQAAEGVVDVFYSLNLFKAIWLSADYQYLWNPAYNSDRGPVNIFGARVHAEF